MTVRTWLKLQSWRKRWRVDCDVNIPHLAVNLMCPWFSVRVLWYHCTQEFKAWPNHFETGIVIAWRWPFFKRFHTKTWLRKEMMPLALYGAMDSAYLARAGKELGWDYRDLRHAPYITSVVRELKKSTFHCPHDYWIATCPGCARDALNLAVVLALNNVPNFVSDPTESPLAAFQRREAEAQRRLAAGEPL